MKKIINENLVKLIIDEYYCVSTCNICEQNFKENERTSVLSCTHIFHSSCLLNNMVINESYLCNDCNEKIFSLNLVERFIKEDKQ